MSPADWSFLVTRLQPPTTFSLPEAFPPRHRLRTDLRGRICLPALGSLPITRRREQDACFADGDPGSGFYSHYVGEFAERDYCPGPFVPRGFPVSIRPTATASPGHAIP